MKHLLSTKGLTREWLEELFSNADRVRQDFGNPFYPRTEIMISFFAEPSTRTRFSFEAAATHLGIRTLTAADASTSSSLKKGETLKDTFRTLSQYGNIIVCRHPDPKWIEEAKWSRIPVINAGSGSGEHPTQALLDLYTIKKELGTLDDLKIMLCGDLLYSRTVHSLVELLKMYNAHLYLVPAMNRLFAYDLPQEYLENYDHNKWSRITTKYYWPEQPYYMIDRWVEKMDIIYMTRMQKERHDQGITISEYFKITSQEVKDMKPKSAILHPLPRGDEISEEVDDDPRAAYHERQVRNGLYIRIALLKMLLDSR